MSMTETQERREEAAASHMLFSRLTPQPADALLALIGLYAADPRQGKIDLGVGVYKTEGGETPVFASVKAAEEILLRTQQTKSYVGPEGDIGFFRNLLPLIFGNDAELDRIAGLQTPGGTGALRLAAELIALTGRNRKVYVGAPTWANHQPVFAAARLEMATFRHIDLTTQDLCFEDMIDALGKAEPGDIVLLHGCCHNPTGADLSPDQWEGISALCAERHLLPFIDLAYQGLGDGLEADAAGVRIMARHCPELIVAYSCDKNFGLYRERVGALFVVAANAGDAALTQSNLLGLARANWSMPPDHGAAIVRIVLDSAELTASWRAELEEMRLRIAAMRAGAAALDPALGFLTGQKGMFSTLPLSPDQVKALREDHGVYMAGSGRINIAGLISGNLANFVAAIAAVR
ncbi:MAG: amino acid aminotransferase [Sphingobium sp.]